MIKLLDIHDDEVAQKILNIQIPSYLVEAKIIGYSEIPPLKDTIISLQQSGEIFFGYFLEKELCGVISFKIDERLLDIHRLVVHPKHFRKGIAQNLLNFIENRENIEIVKVSTGSKNIPAINLYSNNGYHILYEEKINEHLSLTYFEKKIEN